MATESTPVVDPTAATQGIIEKTQALIAERGVNLLSDIAIHVLGAVAIFIVGRWIAGLVRGGVRKLLRKRKVDETLVLFVSNVLYVLLMAFIVIAVLKRLGVDTTSAVAVVGAAGLAIGFAL